MSVRITERKSISIRNAYLPGILLLGHHESQSQIKSLRKKVS